MDDKKTSISSIEARKVASESPEISKRDLDISRTNAKLANPLYGIQPEELEEMGAQYARDHGMEADVTAFRKGAVLAQDPLNFENMDILDDEDLVILRREYTHKWSHPSTLYHMVVMCSVAAAVQGMDESVINGGK